MRKFTTIFYLNDNILNKDFFLFSSYIAQNTDLTVDYVYPKWPDNQKFQGNYRGVNLIPIKSASRWKSNFWSEKELIWYLLLNSKKIDVLSLIWLNRRNLFFAKIYKFLNPKGICLIKGDISETSLQAISNSFSKLQLIQIIKDWFYKDIDFLTCETSKSYQLLKEKKLGSILAKRVIYMPNGFDDLNFEKIAFKTREFDYKEDIIISVGRIGHVEKNNELVLKALDGMDMKQWKFLFIGPVEKEFYAQLRNFHANNPDKKEKVLCVGSVEDKYELWDWYDKSKVFVLTSPKEGFPNVFPEALFFGNYVITTSVSSSYDITKNGKLGSIIGINDHIALKKILENYIFSNSYNLEYSCTQAKSFANDKFIWSKIIQNFLRDVDYFKKVY